MRQSHAQEKVNCTYIRKFDYKEVEEAFANGFISLKSFAEVLADNFGKKKARKILRRNLDQKLKEEKMPFDQRQEHLFLISLLV
jgi:hypothetical protein